ncbi:RNA pyrophosphohydrolase [Inquilinus limosus]|uniref:RNA pyrophosphohydrolase n=1 Tax=Inquilinus limosus MP06 TaxID=1398085 RepID=A0A0A0D1B8_9PROT|nr:RNA pyrophosphohydrolase [Inquilinus limosus]KGM31819.1 RNA pyrophosphohydrolase [Inquilinus limosus MP06]
MATTDTPKEGLPYRPCVGIMLLDRDGRVFVARRRDTPDGWQMPQGGIDPGETARQAAFRELKEEIGTDRAEFLAEAPETVRYDLPDHLVGKVWGGRYRGQEQRWVALRFLGTDGDIDIETEHPEFDAWRWSAPDRVLAEIVPFKRDVYATVLAAFSELLGRG